ncbi:hypothetical protein EDD11_008287 [Mortierella claussenii]|nr:hypothetical protein EDD11_008287 [Mortierella claussenii]
MATNTLTLFCLVSGEALSNVFSVTISPSEFISDLKEIIKAENPRAFDHIDANDLALWLATIPFDDNAGDENIITLDDLNEKAKLDNPRTSLSKLFPKSPEDNAYIIIERPKGIVNKRDGKNKKYWQYVVDDIKTATLEKLRRLLQLHFEQFDGDDYVQIYLYQPGCAMPVYLANDDVLRTCLRIAKDNCYKDFTVSLDSPAKSFSSYTWKDAQNQYGVRVFGLMPKFDIQPRLLLDSEKTVLKHIVEDCVFKSKAYLLGPGASEATTTSVVDSFMVGAIQSYTSQMFLAQQWPMSGMRGHGAVDFAVIDRVHQTQVLVVTKVKKENYSQGLAQNMAELDVAVQQEKRKRMDELDEGRGERLSVRFKSYGIATDSFRWTLVECILDERDMLTNRTKDIPGILDLNQGLEEVKKDCEKVFRYVLALYELIKDEVVNRSAHGAATSDTPNPSKRISIGSSSRAL